MQNALSLFTWGPVSQLAEDGASEALSCRFDSRPVHQKLCAAKGRLLPPEGGTTSTLHISGPGGRGGFFRVRETGALKSWAASGGYRLPAGQSTPRFLPEPRQNPPRPPGLGKRKARMNDERRQNLPGAGRGTLLSHPRGPAPGQGERGAKRKLNDRAEKGTPRRALPGPGSTGRASACYKRKVPGSIPGGPAIVCPFAEDVGTLARPLPPSFLALGFGRLAGHCVFPPPSTRSWRGGVNPRDSLPARALREHSTRICEVRKGFALRSHRR